MTAGEGAADTVELVRLDDGENRVVVRVLGRHRTGVPQWHDHLDAEIVVAAGFATGRLEMCLAPRDLDGWAAALDALAAGRDAAWCDDGRGPELRIVLDGPYGCPSVVVTDPAASGVAVHVPVVPPAGWVEDHRERLARVRRTWPSEVVETSPFVYEWRRRG